jgi:hypothetical protein
VLQGNGSVKEPKRWDANEVPGNYAGNPFVSQANFNEYTTELACGKGKQQSNTFRLATHASEEPVGKLIGKHFLFPIPVASPSYHERWAVIWNDVINAPANGMHTTRETQVTGTVSRPSMIG